VPGSSDKSEVKRSRLAYNSAISLFLCSSEKLVASTSKPFACSSCNCAFESTDGIGYGKFGLVYSLIAFTGIEEVMPSGV